MSLRILDLRAVRPPYDDVLPRPDDPGADVYDVVADVVRRVRTEGDAAVVEFTKRFDGVDVSGSPKDSTDGVQSADGGQSGMRVPPAEIEAALQRVGPELKSALTTAFARIVDYHAFEGTPPGVFESGGVSVSHLTRPVARAGVYAPGGRARYPSTVLMCAAPARVAGVEDIALCVPPASDGKVDDATLAAAAIAGITEVYRIGGAQAVAAMAFGTASIPRVDVIAGPGNAYVAEAKRQLSGVVGVASAFAGPSEIVVVAGAGAPPEFVAIDLVVQAEHGPDGLAWLVTWDEALLEAVSAEVDRIVEASPRRKDLEATLASAGIACLVSKASEAMDVANTVAPEHLQLMVAPDLGSSLLELVQSAGAVFVGRWAPASFGDYIAGPNHVLPTNRTARFSSALRADDFRKHIHAVTVTPDALVALGPSVIALATTEGLPAHAESVRRRLDALNLDALNSANGDGVAPAEEPESAP
jgi:histidinol dehydrogenase